MNLELCRNKMKKIVYVDMDNVLVNFESGIQQLTKETQEAYAGRLDEVPGIFGLMEPLEGGIEAVRYLAEHFEVYMLSTATWENPSAWSDKLLWIKRYLPKVGFKRLILSHNKHLNAGDYLIDDRTKNGAGQFKGELLQFGQPDFPDWKAVISYLQQKEGLERV